MVIFIDTDKMMCSGLRKYYEHLHVMYKTIYTVMRQDHYDDIGKIGNQSEKKYIYMKAIRYLLRILFYYYTLYYFHKVNHYIAPKRSRHTEKRGRCRLSWRV